ncbi:hypothetical protein ACFLZ3_05485, partial [Candidatus Omnitrophota bacterium]
PRKDEAPLFQYDQFIPIYNKLDDISDLIQTFISRSAELYRDIESLYQLYDLDKDSVEYAWHDSLCPNERPCHKITVEVSPNFQLAETYSWDRVIIPLISFENCMGLRKYYDRTGENTWVRVTRMDPARKNMGILGVWNPLYNFKDERGDKYVSYSRITKVRYDLYRRDSGQTEYGPYVEINQAR